MRLHSFPSLIVVAALMMLGGCATRPINPPIEQVDLSKGYRFDTRWAHRSNYDAENLVVLAFSGGGTRAAAFSYGVLETLRGMEVIGPKGRKFRMLDEVDLVTGVSGGSFTALAFGLYGDKLFDIYESSFLKRDVQGELIARALNPGNWGALSSENWGRSELAAQFYDEILFHGATYADLDRGTGPLILASATDISTGARLGFMQYAFDFLCSDLNAVPLSRAAAASSAVPFVLSPVTLNNYGGSCKFAMPKWIAAFGDPETAPRPAARALKTRQDLQAFQDGVHRPYIHLVDGGLADNLGMRAVLEVLEAVEALSITGTADTARSCSQDHCLRRQLAFLAGDPLGRGRACARQRGAPDQGDRRADRPLFVRGSRAVERYDGPMAEHAADSGFGDLARESRSRARGARKGAGHRTSCHRCVLPRPQGQGRS